MSFFCLLFVECVCYSFTVCTLPNILSIKIAYDSRDSKIPFICTQIQYFVIAMYLICMIKLITDRKISWIFFMFMGNINIFLMIILCFAMNIYQKKVIDHSSSHSDSEGRSEENKHKGMDPIVLTGFIWYILLQMYLYISLPSNSIVYMLSKPQLIIYFLL